MKKLLPFLLIWSSISFGDFRNIHIDGGTDETTIGNSGDKLKTDGSGVTQPISAVSLPLPTGASTSANQSTEITSLQIIDDAMNANNSSFVKGVPVMGVLDDVSYSAPSENNAGPIRMSTDGRLMVDAAITTSDDAAPVITRTDIASAARTTTGNSGVLDTQGFGTLSFQFVVSAASGTLPTLDFEIQSSEDQINWGIVFDSQRFTTSGAQRLGAIRISARYYRIVWTIGGTTPSFTFSCVTTLKSDASLRSVGMIRYQDIDFTINGNASSRFTAASCANVGIEVERGAGGVAAGFTVQASQDGNVWVSVSTNQTVSASAGAAINFSGQAYYYYRLITSNSIVGAGIKGDIYWFCNGGS